MGRTFHTVLILALLNTLIPVIFPSLNGQAQNLRQEQNLQQEADSLKVEELFSSARVRYEEGEPYLALNTLGEVLQMAMQLNMDLTEASVLELIGDIYISEEVPEEAIPYYLRAGSILEFAGDKRGLHGIYLKTGDSYSAVQVYEKALEYYLKAAQSPGQPDSGESYALLEKLGTSSLLSDNSEEAIAYFNQYEELLNELGEDSSPAWKHKVNAYAASANYEGCLAYTNKLLERDSAATILNNTAVLHNNMGYYYTRLNRYQEALEHYTLAVKFAEEAGIPAGQTAVMKANMGVCSQNMNAPKEAKEHMSQALGMLRKGNFPGESSRIENIQALIYFNEDDLYNAGLFCRESISSAETAGDNHLKADAYLTYSRVLRAGNDPVNALRYYESYLAIRDSIQLEEKLQQEQLKQRISRLERSESELLLRLKEERVNELAINRLTLQLEREEQARDILEKENDLRLLEQERLRQSLVITEQQYRVEQQIRQNRILEQEQRLATLALEQEQQKQREAEQEIVLLEQQQRLDQLSLDKQKEQRKALIGIVVLMILVVILVTGSLVLTRKKNMLLDRQKKEIQEKNLDLEQKNEEIEAQRDEIEAQRDLLFGQNEALEEINLEVTRSIEYAKRIQAATLPNFEILQGIASEHFLFFKPRDIVSGDYYWMAQVEESTVVVVADCTGHGVPGAFMSVMGMSLLKELVQKEYLTHPGVILRRMRKEIIKSLGQKGVAGEQRDGMDMSLIEINKKESRIQFAGAYNPLYLVRKSHLKAPQIPDIKVLESEHDNGYTLYEIPADKMPVAFYDRMDKFTTHELNIEEGDGVYMFTDGYPDQFGGEKGKKFKYIPFKKLILKHAHLEMKAQNKVLETTLHNWMGSNDQVDDICIVGLRF